MLVLTDELERRESIVFTTVSKIFSQENWTIEIQITSQAYHEQLTSVAYLAYANWIENQIGQC